MKKLSKEEALRIVHDLHRHLDIIYGNRLKGVYLYGSYARGDAREDSDIDVAIILKGAVNRWQERERTGRLISDLCIENDCIVQTMFVSEKDFSERPYSYHESLAAEGIPA